MPLQGGDFPTMAAKLTEAVTSNPEAALQLATEIRDAIELVHTDEYPKFLESFLPIFIQILTSTTVPQFETNPTQNLRALVIDLLNRFPTTSELRPHAPTIVAAALNVLANDNEEVASVALKLIMDLHKSFRSDHLRGHVNTFLTFVAKAYSALPNTINIAFSPSTSTLTPASSSFKILAECPLIVVLMFQLYEGALQAHLPALKPLIVAAIGYSVPPGVDIKSPPFESIFGDFVNLQVKTLSFMAFLMRNQSPIEDPTLSIPNAVVQLLQVTPPDATRKELLLATRHILAAIPAESFAPHLDALLKEEVFLGAGAKPAQSTLRPLAYITLVDVVQALRDKLNLQQLARIVYIFSRNIHDPTLGISSQTVAAKLLVHLIEPIQKAGGLADPNANQAIRSSARQILFRILHAFVAKFTTLKSFLPTLTNPPDPSPVDPALLFLPVPPAQVDPKAALNDAAALLRALTSAFRLIVFNLNASHNAEAEAAGPNEAELFSRLLNHGLACFSALPEGPNGSVDQDTLNDFSVAFTLLRTKVFATVINSELPALVEAMAKKPSLLTLPSTLLVSPEVRVAFASALLNYILKALEDKKLTSAPDDVHLRLSKALFDTVRRYPEHLQTVLQPAIAKLVHTCISAPSTVDEPAPYFLLLKALFRNISGQKFDVLYKEMLPLLSSLLQALTALADPTSALAETSADLFTDLCLNIPVRLSALIPHIPHLIKPLIAALSSTTSKDLVSQGLRTLELFVDNLSSAFLETIIAPHARELSLALWAHLKSPSSLHGTPAVWVLGKLGGRARRWLAEPVPLIEGPPRPAPPPALDYSLNFVDSTAATISMDDALRRAATLLLEHKKTLPHIEDHALEAAAATLIAAITPVILGNSPNPDSPLITIDNDDVTAMDRASELHPPAVRYIISALLNTSYAADFVSSSLFPTAVRDPVIRSLVLDVLIKRLPDPAALKQLDDYIALEGAEPPYNLLITTCYDPSPLVAGAAAKALSSCPGPLPETAVPALIHILRVASPETNRPSVKAAAAALAKSDPLPHIPLLASCLHSTSVPLREAAQKALEPHHDALRPHVAASLAPPSTNPTTGAFAAATVVVAVDPTVVPIALVKAAVDVAKAEEPKSAATTIFPHAEQSVERRVAALRFLSAAFHSPLLADDTHADLKTKITVLHFGVIASRIPAIVDEAKIGLKKLADADALPRQLLSEQLRPILLNLGDHRHMSVQYLDLLGRLLELLRACFNARQLGERLLQHLTHWFKPGLQGSWSPGEEYDVAAGIIGVFSKLPEGGEEFLPQVLVAVQTLEGVLPPHIVSPYRDPLLKYLCRWPEAAVLHFVGKKEPQTRQTALWTSLLKHKDAAPLREALKAKYTLLITDTGLVASDWSIGFEALRMIEILVTHDQSWMPEDVYKALMAVWKSEGRSHRVENEARLAIAYVQETRLLVQCFLSMSKVPLEALFAMLNVFTVRSSVDFTFLRQWYMSQATEWSAEQQTEVLYEFITWFKTSPAPELVAQALQLLVVPILSFLKPGVIEPLTKLISDVLSSSDSNSKFVLELLQVSTLLLVHLPKSEVNAHKRPLINFTLYHIKSEEAMARQAAYVMLCRFIESHEVPNPRIILQVYVSLLHAYQTEAKNLSRAALDVLLPALPKKLPAGEHRHPAWIKWTKKVLLEEGHFAPQMIHVWQLVTRHPALFYPSRGQFIPLIVHLLPRIGLPSSQSAEHRSLALDLVDLVLRWETGEKDKGSPLAVGLPDDGYQCVQSVTDLIIFTIVRLAFTLSTKASQYKLQAEVTPGADQPRPTQAQLNQSKQNAQVFLALAARSLELLERALTLWPKTVIQYDYFERLMVLEGVPIGNVVGLEVLRIDIKAKGGDVWANQHGALVGKVLDRALWVPPTAEPGAQGQLNNRMPADWVQAWCRVIRALPKAVIPTTFRDRASQVGAGGYVSVIAALGVEAGDIDGLVGLVHKAKNHQSVGTHTPLYPLPAVSDPPPPPMGAVGTWKLSDEDVIGMLVRTIHLLADALLDRRLPVQETTRRMFLTALLDIVSRSKALPLQDAVLDYVDRWVRASPIGSREHVAFLLRLAPLESLGCAPLTARYLRLIYWIFAECGWAPASDIYTRLQLPFMSGLRAKDRDTQAAFAQLFDSSVAPTLATRLSYILEGHDWSTTADSYWLGFAVNLLLGVVDTQGQVLPSGHAVDLYRGNGALDAAHPAYSSMSDLTASISHLAQVDPDTAHALWVQLFPVAWAAVPRSARKRLARAIRALLGRDWHSRQRASHPNVVLSLLEGIAALPDGGQSLAIPKELLKFLGQTYSAWHLVLPMLERSLWENGGAPPEDIGWDLVTNLYEGLGEPDYEYGIVESRGLSAVTRAGLAAERLGLWSRAQDTYVAGLASGAQNTPLGRIEASIREERWIRSTRALGQAPTVLREFVGQQVHPELLLEVAWKTGDWPKVHEQVRRQENNFPDSAMFRLHQVVGRIEDGSAWERDSDQKRADEVDRLLYAAVLLALQEWRSLPTKFCPLSGRRLLELFQRFVELQESAKIMRLCGASMARTKTANDAIPEVKNILYSWRERVPSQWDSLACWDDLFSWRRHVFKYLNKVLAHPPKTSHTHLGHHETAWTINTSSKVARKHGEVEVCVTALAEIFQLPNIELSDAFDKLREQIKCCLAVGNQWKTGLDVINSTNLEFFQPSAQAEFYRSKGEFLSALGKIQEASTAFAVAVSLAGNHAAAWHSWALFCDVYGKTDPEGPERAAACYLLSARYGSGKGRRSLSRVLRLVESGGPGVVRVLEEHGSRAQLPVWNWIPLAPFLLSTAVRMGRSAGSKWAQGVLKRLATKYPQALYYLLVSAMNDPKRGGGPGSEVTDLLTPDPEAMTKYTDVAADAHGTDAASGAPASASPEATPAAPSATPAGGASTADGAAAAATGAVPNGTTPAATGNGEVKKEPEAETKAEPMDTSGGASEGGAGDSAQAEQATAAVAALHGEVLAHLITGPSWKRQIADELTTWVRSLDAVSNGGAPGTSLYEMMVPNVEIPGQYLGLTSEPDPSTHTRIVRVTSVRRRVVPGFGDAPRKELYVSVLATDGRTHVWQLRKASPGDSRSPGVWSYLWSVLNRTLGKTMNARSRSVKFHAPEILELAPDLVMESGYRTSLTDVYGAAAEAAGSSIPTAIAAYKASLAEVEASEEGSRDSLFALWVTTARAETEMRNWLMRSLGSGSFDVAWQWRKQFTFSAASAAFAGWSTFAMPATQDQIAWDSGTGVVRAVNSAGLPVYSSATGLLDSTEAPVPFRLSPAMVAGGAVGGIASSRTALSGPWASVWATAATACLRSGVGSWQGGSGAPATLVHHQLALVLADDWWIAHGGARGGSSINNDALESNVQLVAARWAEVAGLAGGPRVMELLARAMEGGSKLAPDHVGWF